MNKTEALQIQRLKEICQNPVWWAKAFVITVDNKTKKKVPWVARWYQAEMLLDNSLKKVARCGRRTGKNFARTSTNYWNAARRISSESFYKNERTETGREDLIA